ncbi:CRISPR-associated protein Cas1 [Balneicella halophila]|uniref:CRISPR-associated endonuclease Cas1 n=1 Tax=Balneicella halophila TaxID=1537566 RepID=A0A7L4UMZ0_BALHA|nr:type II CRISPR-associated endonuclease Cas1 [Balneicella halophila]PVX49994.1 CRISPR-associated protein Cas1 [Balneicella halophila]
MLKQTLYIGNPSYLKLKNNQLVVIYPELNEEKGRASIEDIALLVLDHNRITISSPLLEKLMEHTVAVVVCNKEHLPNGLMLPLDGHSEMTEHWRHQLTASVPLQKQLWKQTVIAKIRNQKKLLDKYQLPSSVMDNYSNEVQSGDIGNMEGKAANHYWKYLFDDFRRERYGEYPNNLLNFGYAILRSIVARALVSSGLLPAIGIFHSNKYNSYCLADDIMEPYRPLVDALVVEWYQSYPTFKELSKEAKFHLLQLPKLDTIIEGKKRPLLVAITTTTASLYKCFTGERRLISYPEL